MAGEVQNAARIMLKSVPHFVTFGPFFLAPAGGPNCNMLHGFVRESFNICNILAFIALPHHATIIITLSHSSSHKGSLTALIVP